MVNSPAAGYPLLAAPLLVLAEPLVVLLWVLPSTWRRGVGDVVRSNAVRGPWIRATDPFVATGLQAAVLWAWHVPALFDLALANDGWHAVQHLSFFVGALLFWTAMLRDRTQRDASARGIAALCLFVTSLVSGALGALMALSQSPWYAGYARVPMAPFGLTPAQDQQLAGLLRRARGPTRNRPGAMIRWIRFPQQVAPGNGMPDLAVDEQDARDIAAYLYTLRSEF